MKITFKTVTLSLLASILFSCGNNYEALNDSLKKELNGGFTVVNEGNNIIVVVEHMKVFEQPTPYMKDYIISNIPSKVIDHIGRTNFIGFKTLRVDVAQLKRSYHYPTKTTVKALEKLPLIAETQKLLDSENSTEIRKKFDDVIPPEMFEEQILKEWNDLKQWSGNKSTPTFIGYKLLKLPGEVGHFIQIGGLLTNNQQKKVLIEFMFAEASKKIMSIN